jgi:EAL domain-containing protein (putative c-di-GMP-specific phosphodiesterase class I)
VLSGAAATQVVRELAPRLEQEHTDEVRSSEWDERVQRVLQGTDELAVIFQPIVDLETGAIVGLEALSRFLAEPVVAPDIWFWEAARARRGVELEMMAIRAALDRLDEIPASVFLALNASPEVVSSVELEATLGAIPRDRVVLEITEHARVADYPGLRAAIMRLRRDGIRLAIDDAGAGYASLRHILQLTPDYIKLDISLTRNIDSWRPQRALAAALVAFAREIDAVITAEGVETASELAALRDLGVTLGQGFYLGRPGVLPVDYVVRVEGTGPGDPTDVERRPGHTTKYARMGEASSPLPRP